MSNLTETLQSIINTAEREFGLKREAVHDGKYRVRRDRRRCVSNPSPEMTSAIARYELAISILDRFGKTEKESQDRSFIDSILNASSGHGDNMQELLNLITESNLRVSKILLTREKTGQENQFEQSVSHSCMLMASLALRIRDLEKGLEQSSSGVIKMVGS